jgi:hypothetical protein
MIVRGNVTFSAVYMNPVTKQIVAYEEAEGGSAQDLTAQGFHNPELGGALGAAVEAG